MKTMKYKTLKGLLKTTTQMTVEQMFTNRYHNNKKGWTKFKLSETELESAAKAVCKYIYDKNDINIINALTNGCGDISMFQCFYIQVINNKIILSNSLSGDAFRYCKKEYLKSI